MRKEVRQIIAWAEAIGWTPVRRPGDSSHVMLKHRNGASYTLPSSASDYRSLLNAKADLRRLAGVANESGPAARYRYLPGSGFSMSDALADREAREAEQQELDLEVSVERLELRLRLTEILDEVRGLGPRRDTVQVHKLAAEATLIKRRLRDIG